MKGFSKLTYKGILKGHKQNPKDKEFHKTIETKEVKRSDFNKLIQESTKQEPNHLIRRKLANLYRVLTTELITTNLKLWTK